MTYKSEDAQKIDQYVMHTYSRNQVTFVRGQGARLWDDQGKEYIDFLAGIAVCNLGHANPDIAKAICAQAQKLVHVSNLYYTEPQARVAELLVENSFADQVFFCNSGAEANEGALKLARLWGKHSLDNAFAVIAMEKSFHGRTMATLAATGQERIQRGYSPFLPEFRHAPFGDMATIERMYDQNVCAIMVEPVQGEGGVVLPPVDFFHKLRKFCDEKNILLIMDEIQTGLGRTGKTFAYQHFSITPDVMTLAKGLANGLPAGAVCAIKKVADLFAPGTHASTFGAGPVVMSAAEVVLKKVIDQEFLAGVREVGDYMFDRLRELARRYPDKIKEARGLGLMLGLELTIPGAPLVEALWQQGLVVNCTQEKVLRFLPPLVVDEHEVDVLIKALATLLRT